MPHPGPERYGGFTAARRVPRLEEDRCYGASGEREERAGANQADGLEDAHASLLCKDHTQTPRDLRSRDSGDLSSDCRVRDRENRPACRGLGTYAATALSAFHAKHLTQLGDHLDQVLLLFHDLPDVLVGAGNLVEDPAVLAALDALGLLPQVVDGEAFLGLAPAHLPARSVGSALEAHRVAQTADDEGSGPHRPWDDAEIALAGADGALARHEDLLAEVDLLGDVVVMAVDGFAEPGLRAEPPEDVLVEVEHRLAVRPRIALRPEQ